MRKHFAGRAVEYQFSLVEHNYATAVLREQRNLLLDYHHGDAGRPIHFAQCFEHKRRRRRVERRCGFIEHQHTRTQRKNGGDGHLLLLAARKRGNFTVVQILDTHRFKRLLHARGNFFVRHAEVLQPEQQLIAHIRRDELSVDILQHTSHQARHVGQGNLARIAPINQACAIQLAREVVRHGARHHGRQRRLTGTRWADNTHELALGHSERYVFERAALRTGIRERHIFDFNDRIHGCPFRNLYTNGYFVSL